MLVFTDVFARNSVKYQSREYRHAFWDCGTILANTLAITSAHKIPSKIITGFVDSQICSTARNRHESRGASCNFTNWIYRQRDAILP